ncbi:hypothetical protein [Streptomyces sp. NPDC001980]|uniref:hypothetical protein n=1 Tax=Streptomyces sp. NPDC001980 TaxID=3157126 RepID=UPI00332016EE
MEQRPIQAGGGGWSEGGRLLLGWTAEDTVGRLVTPDLWQLHLYHYEGALSLGQSVHPIRPGHVSLVPPNTEVHFHHRGRSEHFYVHLRLHEGKTARVVPVMQDAAAKSTGLADLLRHAVPAMPTSPLRAEAEAWAALWRIAEFPRDDEAGRRHPYVVTAQAHVEEHLARPAVRTGGRTCRRHLPHPSDTCVPR